ncbi:MAG: hypothetical protein C4539_03000 [Ignavibacteriales bacterium]|nr:MAG: hypothetical protein C4539_03000 [Ignavibacteriales bacterium]
MIKKLFIILFLFVGCNFEKIDSSPTTVKLPSDPLQTPTLYGGKYLESPGYGLNWTDSGYGCYYELEESSTGNFLTSTVIYRGTDRSYNVYSDGYYYRLRATYSGLISGWSNVEHL